MCVNVCMNICIKYIQTDAILFVSSLRALIIKKEIHSGSKIKQVMVIFMLQKFECDFWLFLLLRLLPFSRLAPHISVPGVCV